MRFMLIECNRFLIDSNLLIYFADETDSEKHSKVIDWFESLRNDIFLSTQNIREFANVCLSRKLLDEKEIVEFIDVFSARFIVLQDNFIDVKVAIELCKNVPGLFWDANIAAVMIRNKIDYIYTENVKDFQKLGIKAINPLK